MSIKLFVALLAFSIFSAPAPAQTRLGQPWTDQSFIVANGPFKSVLVIAVTEERESRAPLEDAFTRLIQKAGADAVSSNTIMSADQEVTEETIKAATAAAGKDFDVVLLTHLYRVEEVDIVNITDPGTKRSERDFALALWKDWRSARDYAIDAGVTRKLRYVLENSVYYLESADLIWTAQSHSTNPKTAEEIIDSVSKLVTDALVKEQLI